MHRPSSRSSLLCRISGSVVGASDDLPKMADVAPAQIAPKRSRTKWVGDVVQILRASGNGLAEIRSPRREIAGAITSAQHEVGVSSSRGSRRRMRIGVISAATGCEVPDVPVELRRAHLRQYLAGAGARRRAGQGRGCAPAFESRRDRSERPGARGIPHRIPSKALSLQILQVDTPQGHNLTTQPGALVSSSGADRRRKDDAGKPGTASLAKNVVARVSEMT